MFYFIYRPDCCQVLVRESICHGRVPDKKAMSGLPKMERASLQLIGRKDVVGDRPKQRQAVEFLDFPLGNYKELL
jgi:hypothetical protein